MLRAVYLPLRVGESFLDQVRMYLEKDVSQDTDTMTTPTPNLRHSNYSSRRTVRSFTSELVYWLIYQVAKLFIALLLFFYFFIFFKIYLLLFYFFLFFFDVVVSFCYTFPLLRVFLTGN